MIKIPPGCRWVVSTWHQPQDLELDGSTSAEIQVAAARRDLADAVRRVVEAVRARDEADHEYRMACSALQAATARGEYLGDRLPSAPWLIDGNCIVEPSPAACPDYPPKFLVRRVEPISLPTQEAT